MFDQNMIKPIILFVLDLMFLINMWYTKCITKITFPKNMIIVFGLDSYLDQIHEWLAIYLEQDGVIMLFA